MHQAKSFLAILCLIFSFAVSAEPKIWIVTNDVYTRVGGTYASQQAAIDAATSAATSTANKKYYVFGSEKIAILPASQVTVTDPDPVP
jgi:hypothetical protein